MDENQAELLRLIYTRIGMIMEDTSVVALELGAPSSEFAHTRIDELNRSIAVIETLASAAQKLSRLDS